MPIRFALYFFVSVFVTYWLICLVEVVINGIYHWWIERKKKKHWEDMFDGYL